MKLLKAMAIAFSIYSKIPVPQFEWKEEDMEYMMCFFPWIGGVIGMFFFGWAVLCEKFAVGNVCYALIGAAIPLMISGGFHVDGYMDTMDAFHSYQSREKKLEILKDSHIGAFAAIMLALYYMIDIAAISEIHTQKAVSAVKAALYFQAALCVAIMLLVSGWYGAAAIGAALLSFFYFKKKSYKELGGITGDTAGFFVTVCEAAAAAAVAVAGYFL